jgi:hypothetical protein
VAIGVYYILAEAVEAGQIETYVDAWQCRDDCRDDEEGTEKGRQ